MKFSNYFLFLRVCLFSWIWIRFANPHPDRRTPLNLDTDTDLQHCWIRRKNEEYAERNFLSKQYLDPWSTDLKLLEVVDSLSDGPVYLLYLGEGGAGADATARRWQRPLVIIIVLLKEVTQL
jgi:hypothetical protein